MTTTGGNPGNESMSAIGERRFNRINDLIFENLQKIVAEHPGLGGNPFSLVVLGRGEKVIYDATIVHVDDETTARKNEVIKGNWRWANAQMLREEIAGVEACTLQFTDKNGKRYEFPILSLDETPTTEVPAPESQARETRKPATAGAHD